MVKLSLKSPAIGRPSICTAQQNGYQLENNNAGDKAKKVQGAKKAGEA